VKVFVTGGSGFVGQEVLRQLHSRGDSVAALARAGDAAKRVRATGADPVSGHLTDREGLRRGMEGAELVIHAAAQISAGPRDHDAMWHTNVDGTIAVVEAARDCGVRVLVHVSSEAVLHEHGVVLDGADETWPYPTAPLGPYAASKGAAERIVRDSDSPALRTVVIRPCAVWGPGDRTLVPIVGRMARLGMFRWIAGGHFPASTSHVTNLAAGMLLAAEKGVGGSAYFLTDGDPVDFRWFLTELMAANGVELPSGTLGYGTARAIASVSDWLWRTLPLPGAPPLSPDQVYLAAHGNTASDAKARAELGYEPVLTVEAGLRQLRELTLGRSVPPASP